MIDLEGESKREAYIILWIHTNLSFLRCIQLIIIQNLQPWPLLCFNYTVIMTTQISLLPLSKPTSLKLCRMMLIFSDQNTLEDLSKEAHPCLVKGDFSIFYSQSVKIVTSADDVGYSLDMDGIVVLSRWAHLLFLSSKFILTACRSRRRLVTVISVLHSYLNAMCSILKPWNIITG